MAEEKQGLHAQVTHDAGEALDLVGGLLRVAEPGVVFGAPLIQGERTVIVASEVMVGLGAGAGYSGEGHEEGDSGSGGGGGGGFAMGRPVAVIALDAQGVHMTPVVDATKLGIAFLTAAGAMFLAWSQMRRAARR